MLPFVLGALATWRLASLFSGERGPFAIGTKLRERFGVHHDSDGTPKRDSFGEVLLNPVTDSPAVDDLLHEVAIGLTCLWCCSVWVGLFVALLHRDAALPGVRGWLVSALAYSAAAIGFQQLHKR